MNKKLIRWVAAVATIGLLAGGVQPAWADDTPSPKPPAHDSKATPQQGSEPAQLTPEQAAKRDLLRQKWAEVRTLHDEAHQAAEQLHADLKELHDLVKQTKDAGDTKKLKALKKDQAAVRDSLKKVQDVRGELKRLNDELRSYKEAQDFDDALKTMEQMKPLMAQYRDALQEADQRVQSMINKLR